MSSKTDKLSATINELESLKNQLSSLVEAKTQTDTVLQQQTNDHSSIVSWLQDELTVLKEELIAGRAREEELKAMNDAQANEMGITLERYKVTPKCNVIIISYQV